MTYIKKKQKFDDADNLEGKIVLIIDDEIDILDILTSYLEELRVSVLEASNGMEALDILYEQPVDLVITDLKMSKMDGMEFLKKMKNSHPEVRTVVLSGYPDKDIIIKALRLGIHDFIEKPITKDEFIERIKEDLKGTYVNLS